MGFSDFIKKIIGTNEAQETNGAREIAFKDLEGWIKNKEDKFKNKEKETLSLLNNLSTNVIKDIQEKIGILEKIDIESKKAEEETKSFVKENLNNYLNHVKKFIEDLNNLQEKNFEEFIPRADYIFLNFDRKSHMNYRKATILVEKEIAPIKKSVKYLFKYLKKVIHENREIINNYKILSLVKLHLKEINEINKLAKEIDEKIKICDSSIIDLNEKSKKDLESIEKIKKSSDYVENLRRKEELRIIKENFEREIYRLKGIIDFKGLKNIFHGNEKEMKVVNSYKENFEMKIQENSGSEILRLLHESKLNNGKISLKIKEINEKQQEISEIEETIKEDPTKSLSIEIERINSEILTLKNEKENKLRLQEKLKIRKKEEMNLLKQHLTKMGVVMHED